MRYGLRPEHSRGAALRVSFSAPVGSIAEGWSAASPRIRLLRERPADVRHGNMSTFYYSLKHVHVAAVVLSGSLFFIRGVWMLIDSPRLKRRWVRVVPHVVDTILLLSAISLTSIIQQYPFVHAWLTAKVVALMLYIGAGMIAIRHGKRKSVSAVAWIVALLIFAYIVLVAWRHNSWPQWDTAPYCGSGLRPRT